MHTSQSKWSALQVQREDAENDRIKTLMREQEDQRDQEQERLQTRLTQEHTRTVDHLKLQITTLSQEKSSLGIQVSTFDSERSRMKFTIKRLEEVGAGVCMLYVVRACIDAFVHRGQSKGWIEPLSYIHRGLSTVIWYLQERCMIHLTRACDRHTFFVLHLHQQPISALYNPHSVSTYIQMFMFMFMFISISIIHIHA